MSAITSDDEMGTDSHVHQNLHLFLFCWVTPVTDKDGPSHAVDILHIIWRQLHPRLRLDHPLVATTNAVNLADTILREHHHQLTYNCIETRAQATTGHQSGHNFLGIKMQRRPGTSQWHLVEAIIATKLYSLGGSCIAWDEVPNNLIQWRRKAF